MKIVQNRVSPKCYMAGYFRRVPQGAEQGDDVLLVAVRPLVSSLAKEPRGPAPAGMLP